VHPIRGDCTQWRRYRVCETHARIRHRSACTDLGRSAELACSGKPDVTTADNCNGSKLDAVHDGPTAEHHDRATAEHHDSATAEHNNDHVDYIVSVANHDDTAEPGHHNRVAGHNDRGPICTAAFDRACADAHAGTDDAAEPGTDDHRAVRCDAVERRAVAIDPVHDVA
jgi:hypothetical protein